MSNVWALRNNKSILTTKTGIPGINDSRQFFSTMQVNIMKGFEILLRYLMLENLYDHFLSYIMSYVELYIVPAGSIIGFILGILKLREYYKEKEPKLELVGSPKFPPQTSKGSGVYITNTGELPAVIRPLFCSIIPDDWKGENLIPKHPQHYLITISDKGKQFSYLEGSSEELVRVELDDREQFNYPFLLKPGEIKHIIVKKETGSKVSKNPITKYRTHLGNYENWEPFKMEFHFQFAFKGKIKKFTPKIKIVDQLDGENILQDLGYYEKDWSMDNTQSE